MVSGLAMVSSLYIYAEVRVEAKVVAGMVGFANADRNEAIERWE